jgi:hypothetical protein
MENVSTYTETKEDRARRMPNVLEAYARDIEKYGKPLDSGLPDVLRFVKEIVREHYPQKDKL